jgi:branched-subunit amino acid ABC-type transport system permease component
MYWAQLAVSGLFAGAVFALYGLGITMVYKSTRVPNFAHGATGTVGAYVFFKSWKGSQGRLQITCTSSCRSPTSSGTRCSPACPSCWRSCWRSR